MTNDEMETFEQFCRDNPSLTREDIDKIHAHIRKRRARKELVDFVISALLLIIGLASTVLLY